MSTDRLLKLQDADLKRGPDKTTRKKGAWRRGHGYARLLLAKDAHRKGQLANKMSMVAGNLSIVYKEPRRSAAMPKLTVRFFVLTC
eukprot:924779-Pleurochrysis_carterae.AAC.1